MPHHARSSTHKRLVKKKTGNYQKRLPLNGLVDTNNFPVILDWDDLPEAKEPTFIIPLRVVVTARIAVENYNIQGNLDNNRYKAVANQGMVYDYYAITPLFKIQTIGNSPQEAVDTLFREIINKVDNTFPSKLVEALNKNIISWIKPSEFFPSLVNIRKHTVEIPEGKDFPFAYTVLVEV